MDLSVELFGKDKIQTDSEPQPSDFDSSNACKEFVRNFLLSSHPCAHESLDVVDKVPEELPVIVLDVKTPSVSTTPRKLYNEITRSCREFVGPGTGEPRLVQWNKCDVRKEVLGIVDHWNQTQHHRIRRSVVGSFRMNRVRLKKNVAALDSESLASFSPASSVASSPALSETSSREMPTMPSTPRSVIESAPKSSSLAKIDVHSVEMIRPTSSSSDSSVCRRKPTGAAPPDFLQRPPEVVISPTSSGSSSSHTSITKEEKVKNPKDPKKNRLPENQQEASNKHHPSITDMSHSQQSPRSSQESAANSGRSSVEVHLGPLKPTKVQEKLNDDQKVDAIVKRLPDLNFMIS